MTSGWGRRSAGPLAGLLAGLAAACAGEREAPPRSGGAGAYVPGPSRPKCPRTGHWDACTIKERLDAAGLVPRDSGDSARVPFMSVPGARLRVGRQELVVFLYPSGAAMRKDVARLDSLAAAPRGAGAVWSDVPTLITSDNLAAVMVGGDAQRVERVTLAITAGPPQPEK